MQRSLSDPLRFFICLLFTVSFCLMAFTQNIFVATKYFVKKNTVLLRWATTDKELWSLGNKYGYKIDRIQLSSVNIPDTSAFRSSTLLTRESLKPKSDKDTAYWKTLITQNKNAALLYALLYPKPDKTPTDIKQKEKAGQMLFGLMLISCDQNAQIAKAAGLFFTDTTINNNTIYAYRISLFDPPKNLSTKQSIMIVDSRPFSQLPSIDSVTGKFRNKKVALRWPVLNIKNNFAAYIIERSDDGVNFSPVNKTPYVLAYTQYEKERDYADYSDTVPKLNNAYFYRVRGLSHFGELGPPGNIISVKTKTSFDGFPVIDSANTKQKSTEIYWKMQNSTDVKILKGFSILRALKADEKYTSINTNILSPATTQFIDEKPQYINYYKICAISTGDDTAYYLPVMVQPEDREPPQVPKGLSGMIDKSGNVKLKWVGNTEIDLMGYRVFRSNSMKGEFVEATKKIISDTVFSETIDMNTLTGSIYYCITAVDFVYNNSTYSVPVKLMRPDKIAPVPAIFNGISFDQKGVNIKWINSSSDDVSKYVLERQDPQAKMIVIKEWRSLDTTTSYIDTAAVPGSVCIYTLTTTDSSGNVSRSVSPEIRFEPGVRKKITTLSATVNRADKKIELKWQTQQPGIQNFILYKAKKGDALRVYKTLPANVTSFTDLQPYINNIYLFAIKAVFLNGAESDLSDVIEVSY